MGKKVKEFKAGDFIFAKVKGYPAWPARVQGIRGKKYFVFFYGTREIANLPPNMIFDYAENKKKFLTKTVKRKDFNDGVKQIEYDFANNVPLEDVVGTVPAFEKANAEASLNDTDINDTTTNDSINTTIDMNTGDESMDVDESEKTQLNDKRTEESDDAGPLVIDEGKRAVKRKLSAAKEMKTPKIARRSTRKEDIEEKKDEEKRDEEVVSRSGRKIKPKRYIDEDTEDSNASIVLKKRHCSTPEKLPEKQKTAETTVTNAGSSSLSTIEAGTKIYNAIPVSEVEDLQTPFLNDNNDNLLVAHLPSGQYIGVKLFQDRPNGFRTDNERLSWERQSAKYSISLKNDLEIGAISPVSVASKITLDLKLTDEEKAILEKGNAYDEAKLQLRYLKDEASLVQMCKRIKDCLGLGNVDTDECLQLMDDIIALDLKSMMFLKYPAALQVMKRLRGYVGNTSTWEFTEEEAVKFSKQAELIRKKAAVVYACFKNLFTVPMGYTFLQYFMEQRREFKRITDSLSDEEYMQLAHKPELNIKKSRKSSNGEGKVLIRKRLKSSGTQKRNRRSQSMKAANDSQISEAEEQAELNRETTHNNIDPLTGNSALEDEETDLYDSDFITERDDTNKETAEQSKDKESSKKSGNEINENDTITNNENVGAELHKDIDNNDTMSSDKEVQKSAEEAITNEKENTSVNVNVLPDIEKDVAVSTPSEPKEKSSVSEQEKEVNNPEIESVQDERVASKNVKESNKSEKDTSKSVMEAPSKTVMEASSKTGKDSTKMAKESSRPDKELSKAEKDTRKSEKTPSKKSPRRSIDRDARKDDKESNKRDNGSESSRESSVETKAKRFRESTKKPEASQLKTPIKRKSRS